MEKTEWWGAGAVVCLERGADLHMAQRCHCHSLSLASVKSRLVLPFWYRIARVVPEKGPLIGRVLLTNMILMLTLMMLMLILTQQSVSATVMLLITYRTH